LSQTSLHKHAVGGLGGLILFETALIVSYGFHDG